MSQSAPAQNLELRPGEEPSPQKLAELFRGIQQNFDALYSLFPLQGGDLAGVLKLVGTSGLKLASGSVTLAWSASKQSGTKVVKHGLGEVPVFVGFSPIVAPNEISVSTRLSGSPSSTEFGAVSVLSSALTTEIPHLWIAIG